MATTYVPIDDGDLLAGMAGNAAAWSTLVDNDGACFLRYNPGFTSFVTQTASALAREYRVRWRGNLDSTLIAVQIYAGATSGPHTVNVTSAPYDSGTYNVNASSSYLDNLATTGPVQEVIISNDALGGGTLFYNYLRFSHAAQTEPVAGTLYPSGVRKVGGIWDDASYGINSGTLSRLRNNAISLAIDRPWCVAAHVSDTIKAVTTKSPDVWGAYGSTDWIRVGAMRVPICDTSVRWFRVDAYTTDDSPGTAEFSVKIGGKEARWKGAGWYSFRVRLGPAANMIYPTIKPGASNGAAIRTLQVWRTEL